MTLTPALRCSAQICSCKVGVVNEIVGDAVDIPRNTHRVDEAERDQQPPRCRRENHEQEHQIRRVREGADHGDDVLR